MDKIISKKRRGYVESNEISCNSHLNVSELLVMLCDNDPCKRTVGARVLGMRKDKSAISKLINALTIEKKLYPKIAISEALGEMGKEVVKYLIPYLGIISNNQYTSLPNRPFLKNNYPLPRDIIARTICKVGNQAINVLMQETNVSNKIQLSESIDAIGYISYYYGSKIAKNYLINLFENQSDDIIRWKLIRAFQAFVDNDIIIILNKIIKESNIQAFVWEAKRSLKQIQNREKNSCGCSKCEN